ncbi:MAG: energy-coupled thiamine transporter ThiT [Clostridiales bacterium]|nr:energy-coupled thiamine transporter ThiT [Clostridiales bacterium]
MNTTKKNRLPIMLEGAVIAALAFALSFIPLQTPTASLDLSLGLIPLSVYALRRGAAAGMAVGLVWSLLWMVLGRPSIYYPIQAVLDYPVAFAMGGLGGIFSHPLQRSLEAKHGKRTLLAVILAVVVSVCVRWFVHFWSGVIFFAEYAPAGMSPYLYSGSVNGLSAAMNIAMLVIILTILVKKAPQLFETGARRI